MSDKCSKTNSGNHTITEAGTRQVRGIWYQVYVCGACGEEWLVPIQ